MSPRKEFQAKCFRESRILPILRELHLCLLADVIPVWLNECVLEDDSTKGSAGSNIVLVIVVFFSDKVNRLAAKGSESPHATWKEAQGAMLFCPIGELNASRRRRGAAI